MFEKKSLRLEIDKEVHQLFKEESQKSGRSMNEIAEKLIVQFLKKQEKRREKACLSSKRSHGSGSSAGSAAR